MRALVRTFLGWFSLAFILATRKHQAIHDYVGRSVVVLRNPEQLPESERFAERVSPEGFELPSRLRRASIVVLYTAISYLALAVVMGLLLSNDCAYNDTCTGYDDLLSGLLGLIWIVSVVAIVVFGWRGQLVGCRRRRQSSIE